MLADAPDLLRLLAVPFFGYVAWRDVRTRRVPDRTWYPLAALAVLLLLWDGYATFTGPTYAFEQRLFIIQVAVSLGIIVPLARTFWWLNAFGGADAKAFFVIAVLFPIYPVYNMAELGLVAETLPIVHTEVGVFSLTILSNTVLVGLAYPLVLAGRNAVRGRVSPVMFFGRPIRPLKASEEYGSLLHFPDRSILADLSPSGLRNYFRWRGLDLGALRMYLQWRGATLEEVLADPARYRDPASLPDEPSHPGDGSIATDGGTSASSADAEAEAASEPGGGAEVSDPWGAEAFLADIEGNAYGTRPETLRDGLDALVEDEVVWISPGIPFLVPLFVGLVVALTYGDLLFALLGVLGLV